jgi:phage shock protein PspC (stress-responsive transcriptional regulator)
MFCTQCGLQLKDDDRFCSRCGARTGVGYANWQPRPQLMLDKHNKKIAGVCAGIARHINEDVTLVRVIFLALALTTGIGIVGYFAAWILMPSDHGYRLPAQYPQPTTP